MRIKNKEIRQRRHRKEQTIKAVQRDLRAQYGDGKTAAPAAKKPAAKKATGAEAAKKPAPKPKKAEA